MITITKEAMTITRNGLTTAYLPTTNPGEIRLCTGGYAVAIIQGAVQEIIAINQTSPCWAILIDTPNNPSFNCIYADRIIRW